MNEHLLGVTINDQKAHLAKIREEIRIQNDELTKVLTLIQEAKGEHEKVTKMLAGVRADLTVARENVAQANAEVASIHMNAEQRLAFADEASIQAELKLESAQVQAEKIIAKANDEVAKSAEHLESLQGFIVSAEQQAATLANDIGSLEQQKTDIAQNIVEMRSELDSTISAHTTAKELSVKELKSLENNIKSAQAELEKVRAETARTFENLDAREKKVKTAEQDNEVLRQRLAHLIELQFEKLK